MTNEEYKPEYHDAEGESPWALQYVVKDTKDFSPLQLAHSLAVSTLYFFDTVVKDSPRDIALKNWLNGRIRKILRRAKNAAWNRLSEEDGELYLINGMELRIFTPTQMDSIPTAIAKTQVSHLTTLPNEKSYFSVGDPKLKIYINRSLNMSASKAAVAAAHVAQLMAMKLSDEDYLTWRDNGFNLEVSSLAELNVLVEQNASVLVRDAGLTEVVPGSITAAGFWQE